MEKIHNILIYSILYFFGSISCISLILIIIVYIFENSKRKITPAFELIFYLSIASLINTISFLLLYIPDSETDSIEEPLNITLCKVQGSLIFFSELSQYSITTFISIFIFGIKSKDELHENFSFKKRLIYIIFSFGISAIITIIGLAYDIFGKNRNKCWIKKELDGLPIFIDCLVIWILILINLILAFLTYIKKFKEYVDEEILYRIDFSNKISMYPIVSFICWMITSLASYFDHENKKIMIIDIITILFNVFEGFLYAIVTIYFFKFRNKIKKIFKKLNIFKNKTDDFLLNDEIFEVSSRKSTFTIISNLNNNINTCESLPKKENL